jgi:prepilin-type processing-associated H-X9-DG protein
MPSSQDVLISASAADVKHKLRQNVTDGHQCYWRVSGTPRQTAPGASVLFADGHGVHSKGEITALEDGRIWFTPLERVNETAPRDPPSRGFTYVGGESE